MNRIIKNILGERTGDDSERYFMTITTVVAAVFAVGLCFFHRLLNLGMIPVYITCISIVILFYVYYLVRFTTHILTTKLLMTLLGLVLLDLVWYTKSMSVGPMLFFILIFGALVIWVWEGRALGVMIVIYFLNIILLFVIEYTSSSGVFNYENQQHRTIDIYISFAIFSLLLVLLLSVVKKEFIRQRDEALLSDRKKSAFLTNVSHEIRTPMNAIVGFSELLDPELNENERKIFVKHIKSSSESLLKLINELIDLSKIEAGQIQPHLSEFSLFELFEKLKTYYSLELLQRNKLDVQISYVLEDNLNKLYSDQLHLEQVLSNLLGNAVKFTALGTIIFECRMENKQLLFCVKDTGVGIPEDDQSQIFDRFVNFNYHGMNAEGSGIGLSIVEKIIEMLHGRLWLESVPGKGTEFYFTIPISDKMSVAKTPVIDFHKKTRRE